MADLIICSSSKTLPRAGSSPVEGQRDRLTPVQGEEAGGIPHTSHWAEELNKSGVAGNTGFQACET